MAVTFVAGATAVMDTSATNVISCVLTVAGGHSNNAIGVVCAWHGNQTVTSVVWDAAGANQSFTSVGSPAIQTGDYCVQLFRLVNPTAGSSKNITLTLSASVGVLGICAGHFDGVDQATPIRAASYNTFTAGGGSISPANLVITSATNDITWTGFASDTGSQLPTTNKTLIDNEFIGAQLDMGADYAAGAATVTHTWTQTHGFLANLAIAGASWQAAGATGTPLTFTATDSLAGGELL
jgi:hypothetical protein